MQSVSKMAMVDGVTDCWWTIIGLLLAGWWPALGNVQWILRTGCVCVCVPVEL